MLKSKVKIENETNFENLSKKLSLLGSKMILESLDLLANDKAKFIPQNENEVTYAKKINKQEAKINWKRECEINYR